MGLKMHKAMYGFSTELFSAANAAFTKRQPAPEFLAIYPNYPPRFGEPNDVSHIVTKVEDYLGCHLPEDVVWLASNITDPDGYILQWTRGVGAIKEFESWVYRGISADVEAGFWPRAWGTKPNDASQRLAELEQLWPFWPKLLPLTGHRALPLDPPKIGNPIFSIMQTDITYYGYTLADWFELDHADPHRDYSLLHQKEPKRRIAAWSDFAEDWQFDR
jgi:hypothetical protein